MAAMKFQAVLMMVVCWLSFGNSSNMMFNLHHTYGGRDSSNLSELRAHDLRRHGRMLGAVDFPIAGYRTPSGVGLYYIKLMIGTPPKAYHVHFDTGSDVLWVNCAGCESCPKKTSLGIDLVQYDIMSSSTAFWVNCYHNFCYTLSTDPFKACNTRMRCQFEVNYAEGSKAVGNYVHDYVRIDQAIGNLQTASVNGTVVFGCSSQVFEQLSTTPESTDGLIGFGQANSSLLSQLTAQGKVKKMFSHCLNRNGGGILAIGQVVQPKVTSIPLVPHRSHYTFIMKSIEVGGAVLDIPIYGIETVIDSGTTLAYFNPRIYGSLLDKVMGKHRKLKIRSIGELQCFDYHGNVDDEFPVVTFRFSGSLKLTMFPHDYLLSYPNYGLQCLGFMSSDKFTLLGDIALSNKLFVFDLERQIIGWTEYNCSSNIKVKDESTGNVYTVGAHESPSSSSYSRLETINIFIPFLIMYICVCNMLTKSPYKGKRYYI